MRIIIRKCKNCQYESTEDNFGYLGDRVWYCTNCYSKYTFIKEILEKDN